VPHQTREELEDEIAALKALVREIVPNLSCHCTKGTVSVNNSEPFEVQTKCNTCKLRERPEVLEIMEVFE
jgi:hypothetical protein